MREVIDRWKGVAGEVVVYRRKDFLILAIKGGKYPVQQFVYENGRIYYQIVGATTRWESPRKLK